MSDRLAVVVVNYGSHRLLAQNLADLPLAAAGFDVVVVDNFTNAHELAALKELAAANAWTVVANPGNYGFGGGMNVGVARAKELGCGVLLLLNPDVRLDVGTIKSLHRQVCAEPLVLVSPAILNPAGKSWFAGGELNPGSGAVRTSRAADMSDRYAWLTGACLAVSTSLWELAGGFDPDYFLYWEDVDFSLRCSRAGAKLAVRGDLSVVHEVGGTQGEGKSAIYMYYNCRNRLLFASRWLPAGKQLAWIARTPIESYRIWRRGGRRSMLSWSLISAVITGSFAGVSKVIGGRSRSAHAAGHPQEVRS